MATRPGEVRINIVGNADRLKRATDQASRDLTKFGADAEKKLSKVGDSFVNVGKKITLGVAALGAGALIIGKQAIDMASDVAETTSKAQVLFGDAAGTVVKFAETAATSLGQSKKAALEGATTFAVFGDAAGLSGEALAKFATDNLKLATDMASFSNTSPEEAIQAIGAAFRGEMEPIRKYGVMLDDATLKQKALELGIYDGSGSLTQQQKVLAANAAIMEQTGAAQGDFARTSGGLANQQRILNAELDNAKAQIGEQLLPVVLKFAQTLNKKVVPAIKELIPKIADFVKRNAETIKVVALLVAALGPLIFSIGKVIQIVGATIKVVQAVNTALTFLAANPVVLTIIAIVAAIAALVAIFVILYKKNEGFRNLVTKVWNGIKDTISKVIGAISDFLGEQIGKWSAWWSENSTAAGEAIGNIVSILKTVFAPQIIAIQTLFSALGPFISTVFGNIAAIISTSFDVIRGIFSIFISIFTGDWKGAWDALTGIVDSVFSGVGTIISNSMNGILDIFSNAWNAFANGVNGLIDKLPPSIRPSFRLPLIRGGVVSARSEGGANLLPYRGSSAPPGAANAWVPGQPSAVIGPYNPNAANLTRAYRGSSAPGADYYQGLLIQGNSYTGTGNYGMGPSRAVGGIVPGRPGQMVPMRLHAGELVLTAAQQARGAKDGGHTFNITVNQSNATASDIAREIAWQMKTMGR